MFVIADVVIYNRIYLKKSLALQKGAKYS